MNYKPSARKSDIVVQDSHDETVIYDLKSNKAFCLNETSTLVWQLCDGRKSVSEISDAMSVQLKTLVSEDIVWLALDQISKDGLLEKGDAINNHFAGLSRREAIRKVGIASMVALPIVSVIVAPNAAHAQSCVGAGTRIPGDGCPLPMANTGITTSGPCQAYCNGGSTDCCSGNAVISSNVIFLPGGACQCVNCTCV